MSNDIMKDLKWSEIAEIEEYLDTPMDEWMDLRSKAKLSFSLQYLIAKRKDPELTMEAAEKLTISELSDLAGIEVMLPKETD